MRATNLRNVGNTVSFFYSGPVDESSSCSRFSSESSGDEVQASGSASMTLYGCSPGGSARVRLVSGSTELDRVTIKVNRPANLPTATPAAPSGKLKISKNPIDIGEKAVLTAYDLKNLPSGTVKFKLSGPIRFNSACTNSAFGAEGEETTIAASKATTDIYGCGAGGTATARVTTSTDIELARITVTVNTPTPTPTPKGDISADPMEITFGEGTLVQATNLRTNGKGARFVKEGPLEYTSNCGLPGLRGEDVTEQSDKDMSQWFYGCAPGGYATVKLATRDKTATVVLDSVQIHVVTPTPEPTFTPTPTKTPTPIVCPVPTTESNAGVNKVVPPSPTQVPGCPIVTATPTPLPPTSIDIELRVIRVDSSKYKVGGKFIRLNAYQWKVLDTVQVLLTVTGPTGFNPRGYGFQGSFQKSTGLQNGTTNDSPCDWQAISNHPDSLIYKTASISNHGTWNLVRCGLGDGTSKLTVTATTPGGASIPTNVDLKIEQAWHQENKQINHRICQLIDEPTTRPNYSHALGLAISGWETVPAGVAFAELNPARCNETLQNELAVTLSSVSPETIREMCIVSAKDPNSVLGCARPTDGTRSAFPHLGPLSIYTSSDLHDYGLRWTSILELMKRDGYRYLPGHLMHELGHTAGLGHSAGFSIGIMGQGSKEINLHANDIAAMEAIYDGH